MFLTIGLILLNIISVLYIYSLEGKYIFYKNDVLLNNLDMLNILFILLFMKLAFVLCIKFLLYDRNNTIINYFILIIKIIFFIIIIYYTIGISFLFLKIIMIENNFIKLDGVIHIGLDYKIERVYSFNEKMNYAMECIKKHQDLYNKNNPYNMIKIKISEDLQNNINNMKTMKDINIYIDSVLNDLHIKKNSDKSFMQLHHNHLFAHAYFSRIFNNLYGYSYIVYNICCCT